MSISNSINAPIGFFDSGVGGLTVLNKVKKLLPAESFVFYGDTAHVPYGTKTKNQLLSYSTDILKFFEEKGCKAVIMACNTTSSLIYDDIKGKHSFELYPVIQSVAKIFADFEIESFGVFATKATIESHAYSKEINKYNPSIKIYEQYCPQWVNIVENDLADATESLDIIKYDLDKMLKNNPEKIILGCTHYPFLTNALSNFVSREIFVDPANYLAEFIKNDLRQKGLLADSDVRFEEFYVSADPKKFKKAAKMFYELDKEPELLIF